MDMGSLSEVTKSRIIQILNAREGFFAKYDDKTNPVVTITFSARPEYQFTINATQNGDVITTSESPGTLSDTTEIFQKSDFEQCVTAIKGWMERIIERERDWMMDEFGGVADRSPNYKG
jgi:hypothetical protein